MFAGDPIPDRPISGTCETSERREHKDGELLLRAGKDGCKMARNTAIADLGKRKDAQKR